MRMLFIVVMWIFAVCCHCSVLADNNCDTSGLPAPKTELGVLFIKSSDSISKAPYGIYVYPASAMTLDDANEEVGELINQPRYNACNKVEVQQGSTWFCPVYLDDKDD